MTEAHEEQEADPVEEERRHEGRAEDKVVAEQGGVPNIVLPVLKHSASVLTQPNLIQHIAGVQLI